MNFKSTYYLFGALILFLVVFLLTQLLGKKSTAGGVYVFPSLHEKGKPVNAKEIQTVKIKLNQPADRELAFVRAGDGWRIQEPSTPANKNVVNEVLQQVMNAEVDEKAEVPKEPKQVGLEPPLATVTLVGKDGREWTLNLGSSTIGDFDALTYVTSSDRPKDLLAVRRVQLGSLMRSSEAGGQAAFKDVNDYRSADLLEPQPFDYQWVSLEGAKHGPVILKRAATKSAGENRWIFEKPPFGEADYQGEMFGHGGAQKDGVGSLLSALAAFRVESPQDFVADNVTDLAKYGLDAGNSDRLRIEVKTQSKLSGTDETKDPVTKVLLIGKKVEEKKEEKKPDEKKPDEKKLDPPDEKYYAALDEGDKYPKSVVKVSGKLREQLLKVLQNPNALRTKDLVTLEDPKKINDVDWIRINNGRETFDLRRTGAGSWDLIDKADKVHKADGNVVERLIDLIKERRTVKEYADDKKSDADLGLDPHAAVVSFWIDFQKEKEKEVEKKDPDKKEEDKKDPKKDEKKEIVKPKGDPTIKLVFGNKKKENLYVRREMGDNKVRAAIAAIHPFTKEEVLPKVTQDKLAYLNRRLPDFSTELVNNIVLVRGKVTYELEKETKDGKSTWKFKAPTDVAGRTAENAKVSTILQVLSGMFADKLLGESPSDGELESYGLKSPAFKVTVSWPTDDKKTKEFVYSFGKETDDKTNRIYARMSGSDWVFLVRDGVLGPLKDELADTTVVTFDPSKVKQVKMTGWLKNVGFAVKFDLERKSTGVWTVNAPAEFKLNDSRVNRLIDTLSKLRAVKFVALKSGAKPEHKFKIGDGALEIEVTIEGEKEPFTLTIGGFSEADKGYYAMSNRLPGDVFILPEVPFGEIQKASGYFSSAAADK